MNKLEMSGENNQLKTQPEILVNMKYKKIKKFKFYKNDYYFIPNKEYMYVFGSNLSGIHRKDLGQIAQFHFNAECGISIGVSGNSYILPVYDRFIRPLSINELKKYVELFSESTYSQPGKKFWITDISKPFDKFEKRLVILLFKNCNKNNCFFPISWKRYLT